MPNEPENKQEIELTNERAILEIPENCVSLTLNCTVFLDGKLQTLKTVTRTLNMKEIQEAVRKAAVGYIDDDDKIYLTDKGEDMAHLFADWFNEEEERNKRVGL